MRRDINAGVLIAVVGLLPSSLTMLSSVGKHLASFVKFMNKKTCRFYSRKMPSGITLSKVVKRLILFALCALLVTDDSVQMLSQVIVSMLLICYVFSNNALSSQIVSSESGT